MNPDRFSSRDGVPWDRKRFRAGARARRTGLSLMANPWATGTHAQASWAAGWADEDQGIEADKAASRGERE